jgi:hypothetical protein
MNTMMTRASNAFSGFMGASSLRAMGRSAMGAGRAGYSAGLARLGGRADAPLMRDAFMGRARSAGRSAKHYFSGGDIGGMRGYGVGAGRGGVGMLGAGMAADFANPWGLGFGD